MPPAQPVVNLPNLIHLDQDTVINLDHVIEIRFSEYTLYEQNGRTSIPWEDVDPAQPYKELQPNPCATVLFNFPGSSQKDDFNINLDPYRRYFTGGSAESLRNYCARFASYF